MTTLELILLGFLGVFLLWVILPYVLVILTIGLGVIGHFLGVDD